MTGGTRQLAEALVGGAGRQQGLEIRLQHAAQTHPTDMLTAAGYVFATPENLAGISGMMKDFFDRCYYPVLDQINGRPYASLVCAGSDGSGAARQIERIATGWRLRKISEPIIVITHAQTAEAILAPKVIPESALARCRDLGSQIAAGIALGVY